MKISSKQEAVLMAIKEFVDQNNYSPSVRDVMEILGLKSSSTAYGHLCRLKRKGLINWEPAKLRTIIVIENPVTSTH